MMRKKRRRRRQKKVKNKNKIFFRPTKTSYQEYNTRVYRVDTTLSTFWDHKIFFYGFFFFSNFGDIRSPGEFPDISDVTGVGEKNKSVKKNFIFSKGAQGGINEDCGDVLVIVWSFSGATKISVIFFLTSVYHT